LNSLNKKDKFIIHDLRNKIFQAKSCLEIAADLSPYLTDNVWLERSNVATDQAHQLLEELLLSNRNSGMPNEKSDKVTWNLQEYIQTHAKPDLEALQRMYPIEIEVTCHYQPEAKYVCLNDSLIKRIKDNVVDNAIKARATNLSVDYDLKDDYYVVTFTDNGCGMTTEKLDKVLLKQFKKDDIHGLGTQFISATAKDHNFVLTYHSELGIGTTVRFLCPYS